MKAATGWISAPTNDHIQWSGLRIEAIFNLGTCSSVSHCLLLNLDLSVVVRSSDQLVRASVLCCSVGHKDPAGSCIVTLVSLVKTFAFNVKQGPWPFRLKKERPCWVYVLLEQKWLTTWASADTCLAPSFIVWNLLIVLNSWLGVLDELEGPFRMGKLRLFLLMAQVLSCD